MARVSRKNKEVIKPGNALPESEKIYKTGLYIRLSSEEQFHDGSHKLDNQEQVIKDYIERKPEFDIYKVYCDNGCTGTNFARNAFEELY